MIAFESGYEHSSHEYGRRSRSDHAGERTHLAVFKALDWKRYECHTLIAVTADSAEPGKAADAGRDAGARETTAESGAKSSRKTAILPETS
jgi:hypothetical protein